MNDFVSMKVLEGLANLKRNQASHFNRYRLKISRCQILLQIASSHVLHHDAVRVPTGELLFESDYIWTIFAL